MAQWWSTYQTTSPTEHLPAAALPILTATTMAGEEDGRPRTHDGVTGEGTTRNAGPEEKECIQHWRLTTGFGPNPPQRNMFQWEGAGIATKHPYILQV